MGIAEGLKLLLKKLCSQLQEHSLPFCLAGGWAVSLIGTARATMDIDILIVLNDTNKKKVAAILENTFRLIQSHENEMVFKNITIWRNIVTLKGEEQLYILDFLKADSDYLKTVIERSIEFEFEGMVIPVMSIEDLIVVKLAAFRPQDQADIENLIHSGNTIDWLYLQRIIKESHLDWQYIEQIKKGKNSPIS